MGEKGFVLFSFDCANWALSCASTAVNTEIWVDFELANTFADSFARANALAATTSNTFICNFVSHSTFLLHIIIWYHNYTPPIKNCLLFTRKVATFFWIFAHAHANCYKNVLACHHKRWLCGNTRGLVCWMCVSTCKIYGCFGMSTRCGPSGTPVPTILSSIVFCKIRPNAWQKCAVSGWHGQVGAKQKPMFPSAWVVEICLQNYFSSLFTKTILQVCLQNYLFKFACKTVFQICLQKLFVQDCLQNCWLKFACKNYFT